VPHRWLADFNRTENEMERHSQSDAPVTVVRRYFEAYGEKQWEALTEIFAENLHFEHHNRNFVCGSAAETIGVLKSMGENLIPDRRYTHIRRLEAFGELVVAEVTWEATATQDIPGFAQQGQHLKFDFCSLFTVQAGRIVKWDDYG